MLNNTSSAMAMKVTLELNRETNLDELMAHLCLMQKRFPEPALEVAKSVPSEPLPNFTIHEGELEPVAGCLQDC